MHSCYSTRRTWHPPSYIQATAQEEHPLARYTTVTPTTFGDNKPSAISAI